MKRKRSLLLQLLIGVVIIITIPTILSSLFFLYTVPKQMERQTEANTKFYIDQAVSSINSTIGVCRELTFNCMTDTELLNTMRAGEKTFSRTGRIRLEYIIGNTTNFWMGREQRPLNSIYLFRNDGESVSFSSNGGYTQEKRRLQQIYSESEELSSARTLYCFENYPNSLYFLLDYADIDHLLPLGKMIVELNPAAILAASDLMELYPGTYLQLLGGEGKKCIYEVGNAPQNAEEIPISDADSDFVIRSFSARHRYYHICEQIQDKNLWLDVYIPATAMYQDIWATNHLYLILVLLSALVALLLSGFLFRSLRKPLTEIERTIQEMPASGYTFRLPDSGYRELEGLEKSFNQMADNLDEAFDDAYQKGIRLQESESQLLMAQMDPHFIFNVLETINMRCIDAEQEGISHIVTDLARFLRGNIGMGAKQQKITFAQELECVRYYLELQRARFGDQLTYTIDYEDEDILQNHLPRMSIQPLVENAVVHGLEPRRGMGHTAIQLWEEDSCIAVRISDNGVGFDPKELDMDTQQDSHHNHIAIANIIQRLYLLYGDRASLQIHSTVGKGTEVLLTIPVD